MKKIILFLVAASLTACAQHKNQEIEKIASETLGDIACKEDSMQINFFDNLKSYSSNPCVIRI